LSATNSPASTSAREAILSSIRQALPHQAVPAEAAYAAIPRLYTQRGALAHEAMIELLIDRLVDYDSGVVRLPANGDIPSAVAALLAKKGESILLLPSAFFPAWLPSGLTVFPDTAALTPEMLEAAHAVLTPCEVAVASTGTIFLCHGASQGRRVITLLPDHHICILREDQVVETIPEAFARIANLGAEAITTISGPSATSDIEMTRIRGVHGPRRLSVILLGS
jgi:L-lactate dehydrogenase complex protein LldG